MPESYPLGMDRARFSVVTNPDGARHAPVEVISFPSE
jgi:hypothetical protein